MYSRFLYDLNTGSAAVIIVGWILVSFLSIFILRLEKRMATLELYGIVCRN